MRARRSGECFEERPLLSRPPQFVGTLRRLDRILIALTFPHPLLCVLAKCEA
jgi:hypothetical protein